MAGVTNPNALVNAGVAGGILVSSAGTINVQSTIADNKVSGRGDGLGGGLAAIFGSSLNVQSSQVFRNHAVGINGADGQGGGVYNDATSTVTVTSSEVTRNDARGSTSSRGGGVASLGALDVDNVDTIFRNRTSGTCDDLFDALGVLCL